MRYQVITLVLPSYDAVDPVIDAAWSAVADYCARYPDDPPVDRVVHRWLSVTADSAADAYGHLVEDIAKRELRVS